MPNNMTAEMHTALMIWRDALNERLALEYASRHPNLDAPTLELDFGRKYVRVWNVTTGRHARRYAYAFIDQATGDVLMPAGIKGPAKHARGNILEASGLECCGPHGVAYIKGPSIPFAEIR